MLITKSNLRKKHQGFTLIELMIAMVIGLIVVAATITIYVITIRGSADTLKSAHLNQDIGVVTTLMINDIRRAGYWGGAVVGADSGDNPFTVEDQTDIAINATADCIVYSYDLDNDGVVDDEEYFGFRLQDGSLEIKDSGSVSNCNDAQAVWVDMIDNNELTVTNLNFDLTESRCLNKTTGVISNGLCSIASGETAIEVKVVEIQIEAEVADDSSIRSAFSSGVAGQEYKTIVSVRNNRIYTQP